MHGFVHPNTLLPKNQEVMVNSNYFCQTFSLGGVTASVRGSNARVFVVESQPLGIFSHEGGALAKFSLKYHLSGYLKIQIFQVRICFGGVLPG